MFAPMLRSDIKYPVTVIAKSSKWDGEKMVYSLVFLKRIPLWAITVSSRFTPYSESFWSVHVSVYDFLILITTFLSPRPIRPVLFAGPFDLSGFFFWGKDNVPIDTKIPLRLTLPSSTDVDYLVRSEKNLFPRSKIMTIYENTNALGSYQHYWRVRNTAYLLSQSS